MIYYWPGIDHPIPSGGVKTHYDHVRILNELGIPASILHCEPGFRCTWFDNDVPVVWINGEQKFNPREDIIVVSEVLGPVDYGKILGNLPFVVFNQNSHYTFRYYDVPPGPGAPAMYEHPNCLGTMVLSPYCAEALRFSWPQHPVYVVPHGISGDKWYAGAKKRQIAFMPRKHPDEAQQVFGYLHFAGLLKDWKVVAINNASESETAAILADTTVFFAFGYPEGGTLPPFEAMAAGCVVVGYGGFSSDHWVQRLGGVLVPAADTRRFCQEAKTVLSWPQEKLVAWGLDARKYVLQELSVEGEKAALAAAWKGLL